MKLALAVALFVATPAFAQTQNQAQPQAQPAARPSICQAVAQQLEPDWQVHRAAAPAGTQGGLGPYEVAIRFDSHSTYVIESAAGVRIATDYAGWLMGDGTPASRLPPRVATMNRAHSSHYTSSPDPAIEHVLPGWANELGGPDAPANPAEHYRQVEDVTVRNVTTDILRYGSQTNGNSIFIFETAGLCIGHLGHLHHVPTDTHYAAIGRLDVVMVPVDGGLTLSHIGMNDVLKRLRSSVILPMHLRSYDALPRFLAHMGDEFAVQRPRNARLVLSLRNLPKRPTIVILPNLD